MALLRTDLVRALDEIASQEEGMRFQGLAVVLGKKRWPELIARQRKKDFGLDAYAAASLTPERIGKGLAASITPKLKKISGDAKTAKENFPDLRMLLFVTSASVGNADRKLWEEAILKDHGLELHIIEREEIITLMMMPENASLCASFLNLEMDTDQQLADLIDRTRRAAKTVTGTWVGKTKGHPLIDLTAVRLDPNGSESADVLALEQINQALSQGRRIVLEGPAGRGKTTTLIQLAQHARIAGTPFIVELPAWISSRRGILEYIAGIPAFQAEGLTSADLARVQQTEPFLLLLNGWNEIAESNSTQANDALRELERNFPSAGIIIATRTHHLTPPLPGALRLRLLRLQRVQRTAYLTARLGDKGTELRLRIDSDPSLSELTRTPFILSEVASLFEAGADIPSTKIGILDQVLSLQEQRDEHRNALQAAPIFGRQTDYLKALAIEMTRRGTVALPEADARTVVASVARELADRGQIEAVGAPAVIATLTAHHILERVDYPQTVSQFEHQQLQEYYAALDVHMQLLDLRDDDREATGHFMAEYVNDPAWTEPLRMIAETFAEQTGDDGTDKRKAHTGAKLVEMALVVDLVLAGELAQLCGAAVWNEVRATIGERFRAVYAINDNNYREYALAAMLATGSDDFKDIIVPLLSGRDQQVRLTTYRIWPEIHVSSLGQNWWDLVRNWNDEARVDFVSELLHERVDDEVVAFAVEDNNSTVREAAASGLMWTGSDDALIRIVDSMDDETFEAFARKYADQVPVALRSRTIATMRKLVKCTKDHNLRLATTLALIELGEQGLDEVVKDSLAVLTDCNMSNWGSHYIQQAIGYLRKTDSAWLSRWEASLVENCLKHLETENPKNPSVRYIIEVMTELADANVAARVFTKLRKLRLKMEEEPDQRHQFDSQVMRQLEDVFRRLPDDVAAEGILSSVTNCAPLDIKVAADLLSRVARTDKEPLQIVDEDLKARLRVYLKSSVEVVLSQDDFNGEEKANLISSIAQVGQPEDMVDLVRLIQADIERMRRGQAARAAGDRGPRGNGGWMSYAGWNIGAVMHLDPAGAEQVLIDLLPKPEYLHDVAVAIARDFLPKQEHSFNRTLRYDLMWAAREGRTHKHGNEQCRTRFADALNAEITRQREQNQEGKYTDSLKDLAKALAAVDGRGSAMVVLDVISMPGQWDQYIRLDVAERLLRAGVILPATTVFALGDSILERTEDWMQDSDKYLLCHFLSLCPFVDDLEAGMAKIHDVLSKRRLRGNELCELVTALGESRLDSAIDILYELASDEQTFEQCQDNFINAFGRLDTPRARELLLGFVDPDICAIVLKRRPHRGGVLVTRLTELARRRPEVSARLQELSECDLPELNRYVLSVIMNSIGTHEAFIANLNLIDDSKPSPVPQGVWDQIESTFIERRPYAQNTNAFTLHARASNELRVRLFRMVFEDRKRRKSAFMLLGRIEQWRLEHGRPMGEPRHPDLASGQSWPPKECLRLPLQTSIT